MRAKKSPESSVPNLAVGAVRAADSQVPLALRRAGCVPVRAGHRTARSGLAAARRRHHSL